MNYLRIAILLAGLTALFMAVGFVGVPVTEQVGRRGKKERDHRTGAATKKVRPSTAPVGT